MSEKRFCEVCNISNDLKHVGYHYGKLLCDKHRKQMIVYGKIIDPTPRTIKDRNEIIMHETYAEMIIRNKRNEIVCSVMLDKEDVDRVLKYKWNAAKFQNRFTYPHARIKGKLVKLHKYILEYYGDKLIDHINRNILDDRKENLRIVSYDINSQNRTTKKNYIHSYGENQWRVEITRNGKRYYKNAIKTFKEAEKIRDQILTEINKFKNVS